ncbi:MAG: hypothetical protein ACI9XP_000130 [Lentimonas sp.]|jgi:hypothetical protein
MKKMRILIYLFCSIALSGYSQKNELQLLLNSAVDQNGIVNYNFLQDNQMILENEINSLSQSELQNLDKAESINLYNLLVLISVTAEYPLSSVNAIDGFFDQKKFMIGSEFLTLNEIEKGIFNRFPDKRLHFVLVCGAIDCPPLGMDLFKSDNLDNQIDDRVRNALSLRNVIQRDAENKKVNLSKIFYWYQDDFGKKEEVLTFLNKYTDYQFNPEYRIEYLDYNWALNDKPIELTKLNPIPFSEPIDESFNIQTYNSGRLLAKGRQDITLFNSLYTENKSNWMGQDFTGFRNTFFTQLLQVTFGISENKKWNLGFDVQLRNSSSSNLDSYRSISNAFAYKNNDSTRFGVTSVGVRARFQPFTSEPNFTIQSTLSGPTIRHPEGLSSESENLYFADWARITWWNQFYYTKDFKKSQLFGELDLWFRFPIVSSQITMLDVPISVIYSYFPSKRWTVYGLAQNLYRFVYNTDFSGAKTDFVIPANYLQVGAGLKYQVKDNVQLEFLYGNFIHSVNSGRGESLSLGIKWIR